MIIHCGDFTSVGKEHEVRNFFKWFSALDRYEHKLIIAGNHDLLFERAGLLARSLVPKNVIYLQDSGVEINGLKFYGTPVQKIFHNWAFNRTDDILKKHWEAIPGDIDILITHSPLYGILDFVPFERSHEGCPILYDEVINRIRPKAMFFGHIHEGRGTYAFENITFVNASLLDDNYDMIYKPVLVEIDEMKNVTVINQ
jgi:Icc-related predicted phosphoesterase